MRRVTVLTDFGTADGYAAALSAVIARDAPAAVVEIASHDIAPGDIQGAALALSRYWASYPPGTVHLVVVDPGVGTDRAALVATLDGRHFVAPDNGVLTWALGAARSAEIRRLRRPELVAHASATFHGRDIFAPVAARLAAGATLDELGPVHEPVRLDLPEPRRDGAAVLGVVLQVDRFGTLITNIPATMLEGDGTVVAGGRSVGPVLRTYGDVEPGALVALVGSLGLLEVSVRDGSAAERLGAGRGVAIRYER